jgi:hypothetical protein
MWGDTDLDIFNVTVDIGYKVQLHDRHYLNVVKDVPVIKKDYTSDHSEKECHRYFHGDYFLESGLCKYYMQAKKICLLIDQDTPDFSLAEGYQNFTCDQMEYSPGYISWQYMRWGMNEVEPTNKDFFYFDLEIEIFFKQSPFPQVSMNMNVHQFDV